MHRTRILIALLFVLTVPLFAETLGGDNVIIANPRGTPLVVDGADVSITAKNELAVRLSVRNATADAVHAPQFGIFVISADRKPVVVASFRSDAGLEAEKSIEQSVTIPLPAGTTGDLRVLLVPVAVSLQANGWEADREGVRRLFNSVREDGPAAQLAIARGGDLLPGGQLVQLPPPPNCTFSQCRDNQVNCGDYCSFAGGGGCAYCDRNRTGQGCSTVCYCSFPPDGCPPNPYL